MMPDSGFLLGRVWYRWPATVQSKSLSPFPVPPIVVQRLHNNGWNSAAIFLGKLYYLQHVSNCVRMLFV